MALPINIDELIHGRTIESERLEFKAGWNPTSILHSISAFANDLNNWGGGYLIVGIAENEGLPVLPPCGVLPERLDSMQKELIQLCHKITPNYFPVASPVEFQDRMLLVIWCPGGDTRPYKAEVTLSEKKNEKAYYVRRFSATVRASSVEEQQLMSMAAKIPFDDRINHHATINDLNPRLIKQFLLTIKSDLQDQTDKMDHETLCRQMQIARGPSEYLKPVNAGLLLFSNDPTEFFPGAKIEIIEFHDEVGDRFSEKTFTGPIHEQLVDALRYMKNNVIQERIVKVEGRAEADRFYNYPYAALEEALANAVYHRSYEHRSCIEVSVRPSCVEILSFPGPLPPVTNDDLQKKRVVSRDYRNRRVGDFLKELHLTEGRNTGFPKISRALKNNGSPVAEYITDVGRISFLATISIHKEFQSTETGKKTSVETGGKASVENTDKTSVEAEDKTSVEIEDKNSVENTDKTSVEIEDKTSVENADKTSVETADKTSVETEDKTSVETGAKASVETEDKTSVETGGKTSVETGGKTSVENTDKTSVENTDKTSVETEDKTSVENTDKTSVENADKTSVENTDKTSVENTDKTSVENTDKTSVETEDKTSVHSMTKSSRKVLELLRSNPKMSLADVACLLGRTTRAVEMTVATLVNLGKLRHVGPKKGGFWKVLDK